MSPSFVSQKKFPALVGVLHLPALPGAPRCRKPPRAVLDEISRRAVAEARALERAGFEGLILENFGDVPFFKDRVPPVTIAAMTAVAARVRDAVKCPLGINVLRNDAEAALAVAVAVGAQFIRVNVLSGVAATDQGIVEGRAAELLRLRAALGASQSVRVWADALVKHARTLNSDSLELALEEVALRSMADATIITGATTGRAVDPERLRVAVSLRLPTPLYLGSGTTPENLAEFAPPVVATGGGVIVGSALRRGGQAGAELDAARVRRFVTAWRRALG